MVISLAQGRIAHPGAMYRNTIKSRVKTKNIIISNFFN